MRNKASCSIKDEIIKKSRAASTDAKNERAKNEKPSPICTIKVPTRETRRKRRRINFGQKNRIMITFTERGKTRPSEVKKN